MDLNENLLVGVPFFSLLDSDEVEALSSVLGKAHFEPGGVIFNFGDTGGSLYVVRSGRVELFVKDHTGQKIVLRVAEPGDMFGELSLLDNGPRTATAMAVEESDLSVLDQENLVQFLRRKPDAALDLLGALAERIRKTNNLLRGRVARNINEEIKEDLTWGQKVANFIAVFSGSMPFLWANAALFAGWIVLNVGLVPGIRPFDPYPFGFLTMAVSLEAIFLSIFVLLAQSLQAAKDKIRADIEYEVNLKAELEIAHMHEKVDQMNADILNRLHQVGKLIKR